MAVNVKVKLKVPHGESGAARSTTAFCRSRFVVLLQLTTDIRFNLEYLAGLGLGLPLSLPY